MANSEITKSTTGQPPRHIDVFGAMRDEMDRVFERFERGWPPFPSLLGRAGSDRNALVPQFDVHDDDKELTIEADLPGVDQKDVTVTVANGLLTIKGERKSNTEEKSKNYYVAERSYGSFERSLRLPDTIDESSFEARFDKGVLKIVAKKRPDAVKAERRIEVKQG